MQATGHDDRHTPVDGTPAPFGINLAIGSTLMVGTTMTAAALFPGVDTTARLVAVCAVVGGYAATVADTRASLVTAGLGYLLFTGFLVNRYGDLTRDGTTSAWHLTVFILVVGLGLGQRWIRHARADIALDEELGDMVEHHRNMKESHGG